MIRAAERKLCRISLAVPAPAGRRGSGGPVEGSPDAPRNAGSPSLPNRRSELPCRELLARPCVTPAGLPRLAHCPYDCARGFSGFLWLSASPLRAHLPQPDSLRFATNLRWRELDAQPCRGTRIFSLHAVPGRTASAINIHQQSSQRIRPQLPHGESGEERRARRDFQYVPLLVSIASALRGRAR